ncbi:uncharacterized protein Z519_03902 [Cladophialophora bantiana CBS 173.52]|uniref:RING-type domain-containing protein n=1 Tax=Cladophialophora bantiana (strain ATCC 10958 / CBS 173.52 / CDC B-1940 / NIH 8579) TaxID=1442370 RepID=A0A0D2HPI9_CLAB1|nr:uncharacterized protein Z519_03902 [Cladophialophora bantiana CBS 173.52]KIW95318.1 hypothetical protein Z519_03902 [Cladophialophora bantiana CBS 173.52]
MYIPRQQFLTEADVWPQHTESVLRTNDSVASYPGMPADFQPPYRNNPDIHSIAVFIQITWMLWFVLILLMMCRALYDRFGGGEEENSDAESEISEAGWRIEDASLPARSVASQHRKSTAICLESLEETDMIRELRCGHVYHANCLNLWVERGHHDCPLCKYDMLGLMKNFLKPHPDEESAGIVPAQEAGQPSGEVHTHHATDIEEAVVETNG